MEKSDTVKFIKLSRGSGKTFLHLAYTINELPLPYEVKKELIEKINEMRFS